MGSFSVLKARELFLAFKTCIKGLPPSTCGFKRRIEVSSCAEVGVVLIKKKLTTKRPNNAIAFIPTLPVTGTAWSLVMISCKKSR